ncbi:MAG: hypothetical protein ACRDIB_12370, partial [Ardenticatenaceae bacterium]
MNKTRLRKLTEDYWGEQEYNKSLDYIVKWYIDNVLAEEMDYAKPAVEPCDTLVLLVGFSIDPLLQSVWAYNPERVVMLFSDHYEADDHGNPKPGAERKRDMVGWLKKLKTKRAHAKPHDPLRFRLPREEDIAVAEPGGARTDWVFATLRELVLPDQQAGRRIVVDITGAKKSMTGGAFLFAAYAGAEINYVDFEDYDWQKRRPYGYTCKIGPQPNPYESFGLAAWGDVRRLYEQFAFRQAADLARKIRQQMTRVGDGTGELFTASQRSAVLRLALVLDMLELWNNGDHAAALAAWECGEPHRLKDEVGEEFVLPPAVEVLTRARWPQAVPCGVDGCPDRQQPPLSVAAFLGTHRQLKRGQRPDDSLFNQPDVLLAYAHDELAKVENLIQFSEDYRSALLRAAALDELLLKARVAALCLVGVAMLDDATSFKDLSQPERQRWFTVVVEHSDAIYMRKMLRHKGYLGLKSENGEQRRELKPTRNVDKMAEYWQGCGLTHQE